MQLTSKIDEFTVLKLTGNIDIKASDEQELVKKLKTSGFLKKVLKEEALKLVDSLSCSVITKSEELKELINTLSTALEKGLVSLVILPRPSDSILFFKEYYYQDKTDVEKVRNVIEALYRILNDDELKRSIGHESVQAMLEKLKSIRATIERRTQEYEISESTLDEYLEVRVSVKKNDPSLHYEIRYRGEVLERSTGWDNLRRFLKESGFEDLEELERELYEGVLGKPYRERSYIKRLRLSEESKCMIMKYREKKKPFQKQLQVLSYEDISSFIKAVEEVINGRTDIATVSIHGRRVIVKSPHKRDFQEDGLIIETHLKSDNVTIELSVPSKYRVYCIPYKQLSEKARDILEELFEEYY